MKIISKLWLFIGVLIILSPLGLLLPEHFKAGSAWGEWGTGQMQELLGYIPKGLGKLSNLWSAPIPDYAFKGWEDKPLSSLSLAYISSAVIGVLICVVVVFILGKFLKK
ncbi:MAG: PDGLE domain-containing protein [Candidatus Omnitrophota bacterium]